METRGDSGGRSKTWTPLTERVGRGIANARRTNSDTAFPSAIDRLAAYCRTSQLREPFFHTDCCYVEFHPIVVTGSHVARFLQYGVPLYAGAEFEPSVG